MLSPEIQNRGISGPKIGHVYVSAKKYFKKKNKKKQCCNSNFHLIGRKTLPLNDFELTASVLYFGLLRESPPAI